MTRVQFVTVVKGYGWDGRKVATSRQAASWKMPGVKVFPEAALRHGRVPSLFSVRKDIHFLLLPGFLLTGGADAT